MSHEKYGHPILSDEEIEAICRKLEKELSNPALADAFCGNADDRGPQDQGKRP